MTGWYVISTVSFILGWLGGRSAAGDGELMSRLAAGDTRALGDLYARHGGRVLALLVRMLRDRAAAEDISQEVFCALWRKASGYDAQAESVLPWLLVVARNRALDQLRSARHRLETGLEDSAAGEVADAELGVEDRLWTRQRLDRLRQLMGELAPAERQVLELAYFEGLTQSEISDRLREPLGTVKTWTRSGLQKLRKAVL